MDLFNYLLFLASKDGSSTSADKVSYDNTTGFDISAENVQEAIDELSRRGKFYKNTTSGWDGQASLIAQEDCVYVYTDHSTIDGINYPAVKIGDGTSYLIDMPFVNADAKKLNDHLTNTDIHITSAERTAWNNKVRCYLDINDEENLIFTTD